MHTNTYITRLISKQFRYGFHQVDASMRTALVYFVTHIISIRHAPPMSFIFPINLTFKNKFSALQDSSPK
jgi:hypothetical protein